MATPAAFTVREVAEYLNVDEKTIYRLVKRRELPAFKVAGTWRFRKQELDAWIDSSKESQGKVRAPRIRALLVEDDAVDRMAIRRAIRESDPAGAMEIVEVSTLAAARAALEKGEFDCAVVDYQLPDGDGLSLLEEGDANESALKGTAVVVLTGMDDDELAKAALRSGAQDYLVKGRIDGNTLLRSVRYAVERRRAEDERRRYEISFQTLIQSTPDGVCVCDGERVVYVNPALRALIGESRIEVVLNAGLFALVPGDDHAVLRAHLAQRANGGASGGDSMFEIHIEQESGALLTLEGWTREVTFDGNDAVVLTLRDVTWRKQLEFQVGVASRMAAVGTLAAGVAHEINNPLTYVAGNVDYAIRQMSKTTASAESKQVVEALKHAYEGAMRVRDIVLDLKTFSRAGDERQVPVSLEQVIESSINIVHNQIRQRGELVKEFNPVSHVLANESKLGQVIINLLVNALHALPEEPSGAQTIRVRTFMTAQEDVAFEIKDTGSGISAENMRRIFDPFFTTKPVGQGTGLGLSVCQGIVTSLGGLIEAESELGVGTTFRVILPAANKASTDARPSK